MFRSTLALHVYVRALRYDPTGVNCFLGVVLSLSFVEKKLVLLFSDFFSHLKLPKKNQQNKGRRHKRERKIKRREKDNEGEKRLDN